MQTAAEDQCEPSSEALITMTLLWGKDLEGEETDIKQHSGMKTSVRVHLDFPCIHKRLHQLDNTYEGIKNLLDHITYKTLGPGEIYSLNMHAISHRPQVTPGFS